MERRNIKVWSNPWIPKLIGLKPLQGHTQINPQLRVRDLIDQCHHIWNIQDLHVMTLHVIFALMSPFYRSEYFYNKLMSFMTC